MMFYQNDEGIFFEDTVFLWLPKEANVRLPKSNQTYRETRWLKFAKVKKKKINGKWTIIEFID